MVEDLEALTALSHRRAPPAHETALQKCERGNIFMVYLPNFKVMNRYNFYFFFYNMKYSSYIFTLQGQDLLNSS